MKSMAPWTWFSVLTITATSVAVAADSTVFKFRTPHAVSYRLEATAPATAAAMPAPAGWLKARPNNDSTNFVEFGSRVVVQVEAQSDWTAVVGESALVLSRVVDSNLFVFQAPDALTAMQEAHRIAALPGVGASYPVMRRSTGMHSPYAQRSNDPFFVPYFNLFPKIDAMWPWENRDYNGTRLGIDLNVLAAWPYSTGQGVTVAVADSGLEMDHPELVARVAGAPHFNFSDLTTNGMPSGGGSLDPNRVAWSHGTAVAGLIAAEANNGKGMAGIAPQARLASWVIHETNTDLVSDERLMDMYQYASNEVAIQNHSWGGGNDTFAQVGPTLLEQFGIQKAITEGRNGLGTILVRSAGNDRYLLSRADDDGYPDAPEVIAVGAVNRGGRATSYSEAGACLLLAAPGGGGDSAMGLFTLDLLGPDRGVTSGVTFEGDLNDYRWGNVPNGYGFAGTSASAPLVSGVAALVLSVNSNLTYRDVQHVLLLSARQADMTDPDLRTNGAGLVVSHNVGFGIPDAGQAVALARSWSNRPALITAALTRAEPVAIPDDGLRVELSGSGVPAGLTSLRCLPSIGPHADDPTEFLRLVDIGFATNVPALNLTNKAALIERSSTDFAVKIANAAAAGAAFAVIYNYSTNVDAAKGGDQLVMMGGTDFTPVPAVFIGNTEGEALKNLLSTNQTALARIALSGAVRTFTVTSNLICEHVGVRVRTDHTRRGDLRITLVSPQGTRSILQTLNNDTVAGPEDWTYWSTHHFLESSFGDWRVVIADEAAGATGSVLSVTLTIRGTPIVDTDHDGLDDSWELARIGSLGSGPKDDPDEDGFSNAREQVMGTDPSTANAPFEVGLSWWELCGYRLPRLTWPSTSRYSYDILQGTNLTAQATQTNVPGAFAETEWLGPESSSASEFFQVRRRTP